MNSLVIADSLFRQYLRDLLRHPSGPLRIPVGVSHWGEHLDVLGAAPHSTTGQTLLLAWAETLHPVSVLPRDCIGVLRLGRGPQHGRVHGVVRLPGHQLVPLHQLRLIGPSMPVIPLQHDALSAPLNRMLFENQEDATRRWSRTIGALGRAAWERLIHLRYGIIGVGRTGSLVAQALTTLGVRHLTLVDPDRVEVHNLGETLGMPPTTLQGLKVDAMAHTLTALAPPTADVEVVPISITRLQALHAVQACDVLICCVDHDSARLATTGLATVFCKPLLDIATGVHGHGAARHLGADIRLVLPGRCLRCFGGLRDEATARQVLASAEAERLFYAQRDWQRERAGSLLSLNLVAVGRALRLLETFLGGQLPDSQWEHLESDASEHLRSAYPVVSPDPACRLCALMGWGEAGIVRLAALLSTQPQP